MRLIGAACLSIACACAASAAEAAERHRLNLPAGRLGDALAQLGRQTRTSIGVSDAALANTIVRPVRGSLSVEEALRRLLRGKAARFVRIDSTTIRIVAAAPPPRLTPSLPRRAAPARRVAAASLGPPPPEPAHIIVTASRRDALLGSYPGSVSIIGGDDPSLSYDIAGSEAIVSRLPSVTSTHLGPGRNKLFVRGVSESSFNGPTQATVGQYLGETRLNYNAPDPDLRLHDIQRVELLAGPQGTLYGAGSLGGIVRVVPNAPKLDRLEATASAGASLVQHGEPGGDVAGVINTPLADDRAAVRVSGYAVSEGGYIDDVQRGLADVNRVRIAGGRLAVRTLAGEHWTIDLGATGQRIRGDDAQFAERELPRLSRRSNIRQDFANDYLLGSVVATREWDDYRFVASTAWVRQKLEERYELTREDNPPGAYDLTTDVTLLSAEARLSRRSDGGSGWVVGASLLKNELEQSREVDPLTGPPSLRNRVENDVVEAAVYGEAAVRLLPNVTATLGGRINLSRLTNSGFAIDPGFPLPPDPVTVSRSSTRFLPAAAVAVRAAPDLLVYGRYQQSFRPGGATVFQEQLNLFRSDKVASAEAGVRYGLPGVGTVDAAAALAYTSWTDIQADTLDIFAEPSTANIGDGRIWTLDLSLGWRPLPGLAIEAAAVFNDSALTRIGDILVPPPGFPTPDVDESPPLPGVARFNGRVSAQYDFAASERIDLQLFAAARYTGKSLLGVGPLLAKEQGNWLDISAGLRADIGRQRLFLTATNLLDTTANRFALGSPFTLDYAEHTTPVAPRTIRLGWQVRF